MKDGQQQVLFIYFCRSLYARLQYGQFQNIAGFLVEHEVCRMDGYANFVFSDALFQFSLNRLQVHIEPVEQVDHRTVIAPEHSQQQMFRTYRTAGQTRSLLS